MTRRFKPGGLPVLVGSMPIADHGQAADWVLAHTPEIPSWVQLPCFPQERMVPQFAPGMPGLVSRGDSLFVDTRSERFDFQMLNLYEVYLAVTEAHAGFNDSGIEFSDEIARGFFILIERLASLPHAPLAVKGQVTGPITFCTGVRDQNDRAIFYHDLARDAAVKLLALKARWQARQLSRWGCPVLVSIDEPALAGFGSSDMIGISAEAVGACLKELIEAIHAEGGLAGIHVCANTDWSLVLASGIDCVNFDSYGYFDRFILYAEDLKKFVEDGKTVAWGIVPTQDPRDIEKETVASLGARWDSQVRELENLGLDREAVLAQSLITSSCGLGSLSPEHAREVLSMIRGVSDHLRNHRPVMGRS